MITTSTPRRAHLPSWAQIVPAGSLPSGNRAYGRDSVELGNSNSVTLSSDSQRLTSGLLGGVTMAGLGLVAAAASPLLGINAGALAGGAIFAVGVANNDNSFLKGLGLAALGGALCATGAVVLGAIPLAFGIGMLAVEGLKMGG